MSLLSHKYFQPETFLLVKNKKTSYNNSMPLDSGDFPQPNPRDLAVPTSIESVRSYGEAVEIPPAEGKEAADKISPDNSDPLTPVLLDKIKKANQQ
jgi:hypothetical protein